MNFLPKFIKIHILSFLSLSDILTALTINKSFHQLQDQLWSFLLRKDYPSLIESKPNHLDEFQYYKRLKTCGRVLCINKKKHNIYGTHACKLYGNNTEFFHYLDVWDNLYQCILNKPGKSKILHTGVKQFKVLNDGLVILFWNNTCLQYQYVGQPRKRIEETLSCKTLVDTSGPKYAYITTDNQLFFKPNLDYNRNLIFEQNSLYIDNDVADAVIATFDSVNVYYAPTRLIVFYIKNSGLHYAYITDNIVNKYCVIKSDIVGLTTRNGPGRTIVYYQDIHNTIYRLNSKFVAEICDNVPERTQSLYFSNQNCRVTIEN